VCRRCGQLDGPADHAAEGEGRRSAVGVSPGVQWVILGFALLAALASAVLFPKSASPEPSRTDRVFAADLSRQADQAARLSGDARVLTSDSTLRDLARSIQGVERAHARFGSVQGGEAQTGTRAASMDAKPFLRTASQHARDDQVLARIELDGGRDPALRARAQRLQRDGRRMLIRLAEAERARTP
jgi:hypothetical protein